MLRRSTHKAFLPIGAAAFGIASVPAALSTSANMRVAALLHDLRLTAGICAGVLLIVAGLVTFRLRGAGEASAPRTPGAAALPER